MKFYFLFSVVNTYETKRTAEQENPVINLRLFIADRKLCS